MATEQTGSNPPVSVSPADTARHSGTGRNRFFRGLAPSSAVLDGTLGESGILNLQTWLGRAAIRPAAGWAALGGLLAGGIFAVGTELPWPAVVVLLVLVDPLWGSVWRLAAGRAELLRLPEKATSDRTEQSHIGLPYLRAGSPASRLFDHNTMSVMPVLYRVAFPSVLLTFFVATALGGFAVMLTGIVVLATGAGWISTRRIHRVPVLLHSLVSIGLPWLLAVWLINAPLMASLSNGQILLPGLWVLHQWGSGRCRRFGDEQFGLLVLGIADIGILLLLIWTMSPLWLALWLALTLPTWLLVYRRQPLQKAEAWQLCAMLVSAAGIGHSI